MRARIFQLLSSKWARSLSALTSSLTKNLIRSGLKFNHSLKELILGVIGGWCPLHLIVALLLGPLPSLRSFRFCRISPDYTGYFVFSSLVPQHTLSRPFSVGPSTLFRATIGPSSGNNLLCIDIKPCYLIELPSSSRLLNAVDGNTFLHGRNLKTSQLEPLAFSG